MHKIDTRYAVSIRPDVRPEADGGWFYEGNPLTGQKATEVSADWLNDVQGNLTSVISAAGIALEKGNIDQLLTAINKLSVDAAHPVGTPIDIRINLDPNEIWPWTRWVRANPGTVNVSVDPEDTDLSVVGSVFGQKTVSLTAEQNGPHSHSIPLYARDGSGPQVSDSGSGATHVGSTGSSGSGEPHLNMQPSFVVNRWWRIS